MKYLGCHNNPNYWNRQTGANSVHVDPDHTLQNSDQDLPCLPPIQDNSNTPTGSKVDFFKFLDKCGKELRCPNIRVDTVNTVLAKSAGLPDKTGIFSFCPAKTFHLSDKCPVNLSKEDNILTTNMPSVLQILICPAKDYGLSDSCPAQVKRISRRQ